MAVKVLCQRCVRDLTVASRASGIVAADLATQSLIGDLLNLSEQPNSLSTYLWGERTRTPCSTSGQNWSLRQYNSVGSSSAISDDKISLRHFKRWNAMPFSTVLVKEQNVTENFSAESLSSGETVVAVAEAEVSVQEFVPEIENTPVTPLVQAIQLQESDSTEELPRSDGLSPASVPSLLKIDSDREVQPGRIYVGGLPFAVKGDELKDGLRGLCEKYGPIVEISLAQHRSQSQKSIAAGKHRGFAFVTMETPEQAQKVIDNLNGASVWGRILMVSYGLRKAEPDPSERLSSTEKSSIRCKVFVGNLHEGTSRLDLVNKFQQYGTIVDVKLITELHSSRSRGFGFVTFDEEGQAIRAVLDSDGSILDGSVIRVNIAKYPQGY